MVAYLLDASQDNVEETLALAGALDRSNAAGIARRPPPTGVEPAEALVLVGQLGGGVGAGPVGFVTEYGGYKSVPSAAACYKLDQPGREHGGPFSRLPGWVVPVVPSSSVTSSGMRTSAG